MTVLSILLLYEEIKLISLVLLLGDMLPGISGITLKKENISDSEHCS
jgi:hypothetical protein